MVGLEEFSQNVNKATVKLSTFLKLPTGGTFGYDTFEQQGIKYIQSCWCRICAKHNKQIRAILGSTGKLKGVFERGLKQFVEGTNFVTKHTVMRHIEKSDAHKIGLECENDQEDDEGATAAAGKVFSNSLGLPVLLFSANSGLLTQIKLKGPGH
jgi:hypothetical protein